MRIVLPSVVLTKEGGVLPLYYGPAKIIVDSLFLNKSYQKFIEIGTSARASKSKRVGPLRRSFSKARGKGIPALPSLSPSPKLVLSSANEVGVPP